MGQIKIMQTIDSVSTVRFGYYTASGNNRYRGIQGFQYGVLSYSPANVKS